MKELKDEVGSSESLEEYFDPDRWDVVGNLFSKETVAEQEAIKKVTISRDTERKNINQKELPVGGFTDGYYTPNIVWFQTSKLIKITIKIPSVENSFNINIVRKKFFKFR